MAEHLSNAQGQMDSDGTAPEKQHAAPERQKYEPPVLVKYGKLEEVTRAYNSNC